MRALITLDWDTLILAGNKKIKKNTLPLKDSGLSLLRIVLGVQGTKKSPENIALSVLKTHFCDTHELSVNPRYILASFTQKINSPQKCDLFFTRSHFMKCTTKPFHISKRHIPFSPNSLTCYFGYISEPLKCTRVIDSNCFFLWGKSEQRLTWAAEGSVSPLSRFVCVRLPCRWKLRNKLPPTVPPPDPPPCHQTPCLTRPKAMFHASRSVTYSQS